MDDSSCAISKLMNNAFDEFHGIIEKAPPELKDEIFDYCFTEFFKNKYHDSGFYDEFMEIIIDEEIKKKNLVNPINLCNENIIIAEKRKHRVLLPAEIKNCCL